MTRHLNAGALALLVACAVTLADAATFTANVSSAPVPLRFPVLECVGSGHGALTMRADYRAHLAAAQRDIGFAFVRGHGWLDDDMSTYLPNAGAGAATANMFNIFSAIDYYLSVRIKPVIEVSFMPEALANGTSECAGCLARRRRRRLARARPFNQGARDTPLSSQRPSCTIR
jgi:hypothetical protein